MSLSPTVLRVCALHACWRVHSLAARAWVFVCVHVCVCLLSARVPIRVLMHARAGL